MTIRPVISDTGMLVTTEGKGLIFIFKQFNPFVKLTQEYLFKNRPNVKFDCLKSLYQTFGRGRFSEGTFISS